MVLGEQGSERMSDDINEKGIGIAPELRGRLRKAAALHNVSVNEAVTAAVEAWVEAHCPIPGCPHVFMSRGGWDQHVASLHNHANWNSDVKDGEERKRLFTEKYPGWTRGGRVRRV